MGRSMLRPYGRKDKPKSTVKSDCATKPKSGISRG